MAEALRDVERAWLRGRFDPIDDPDYNGAHDDDFDYRASRQACPSNWARSAWATAARSTRYSAVNQFSAWL
ncbi:hypothetical protein CS0771_60270 [Catellatospora sp. IY07-71]|nr:hypothetical protein CS0771_60270 [Catellatospora sp. IY07-71]